MAGDGRATSPSTVSSELGVTVRRWTRGQWVVVVRRNGQRRVRSFGENQAGRARAEEFAAAVRLEIAQDLGRDAPDTTPAPASTVLERWLDAACPSMKKGSELLYRGAVRRHLAPHFGETDLRSLTHADLIAFANALVANGAAPSTVRNALVALRLCCAATFRMAFRSGEDPFRGVGKRLRGMELRQGRNLEPRDSWEPDEAARLLGVALDTDPAIYLALLIGLHTGARRGEILALRWSDIERGKRRIHIRRALTHGQIASTKTGKSRSVAASAEVLGALSVAQEAATAGVPWIFEGPRSGGPDGVPMTETAFSKRWEIVRARAAAEAQVRPLAFHCARHTFASLALSAGKSVRWVADMLGHADPQITLRVYAHALPSDDSDLSFLPSLPAGVPVTKSAPEAVDPEGQHGSTGTRNFDA